MTTSAKYRYDTPLSWRKDAFLQTYKSQTAFISDAFKWMAIAGGGAAIALLAHLGAQASACANSPDLVTSISYFSVTLFAAIVAYVGTYFSQMEFLKHLAELEHRSDEGITTTGHMRWHVFWFFVAVVILIIGLVSFVAGAWSAADEFSSFQCEAPAAHW